MEEPPKRRRYSSSTHPPDTKGEGDATEAGKSETKEGESSPARCPICLAPPENRAKSESCSHFFCFSCLKEWSKVKAECPLCKMPIRAIFYNIKNDREFDEYQVKVPRPQGSSFPHHPSMMMVESFDNWWHYRIRDYRAQLRRRRENELAARAASSNINAIRTRRMHYWNKTRVHHVETGNRVRDVSSDFFRENPSQMHRLEPWLKRELTVLYGAHNRILISRVRDLIISAVPVFGITSQRFINMIQPYMLEHTDQFVHEFVSFAKSPFDIQQYDRYARYIPNREPDESQRYPEGSRNSSRSRRRSGRNPPRSRWDESPDAGEHPAEPTSQSVMLSQTSWGDDLASLYPVVPAPHVGVSDGGHGIQSSGPEHDTVYVGGDFPTPPRDFPVGISNPGFHYTGLLPSRRHNFTSSRDANRHVEAPLVHQTLDVHRHGGSSARDYQRMEIMRRHFDRHSKRRHEEARKRRCVPEPTPSSSIQSNPSEVIVISSDSSDKEQGTSSGVHRNGGITVLHYKPAASQQEGRQGRFKIKEEKNAKSSSSDASDSSSSPDDSDIEFVKYIKPPCLRTPDVFIDLSSVDDDAPGPSNRYGDATRNVTQPTVASSSASNSDSGNSSEVGKGQRRREFRSTSTSHRNIQDILVKTKEFLQKTREATKTVRETQFSAEIGGIELVTLPESTMMSSNDVIESMSDLPLEIDTSQSDSATPIVTSSIVSVTSSVTSVMSSKVTAEGREPARSYSTQTSMKTGPKKVFERGKVSVTFIKQKMTNFYGSDSDSEIDVGVEEIRPSGMYSRRPIVVENSPKVHEPSVSLHQNHHESPILLSPTSTHSTSSAASKRERSSSLCEANEYERLFREPLKKRVHRKRASSHSPGPKKKKRRKSRKRRKRSSRKSHDFSERIKKLREYGDSKDILKREDTSATNHGSRKSHDLSEKMIKFHEGRDILKRESTSATNHGSRKSHDLSEKLTKFHDGKNVLKWEYTSVGHHEDAHERNRKKSKKSHKKKSSKHSSRPSSVEFVSQIHRV